MRFLHVVTSHVELYSEEPAAVAAARDAAGAADVVVTRAIPLGDGRHHQTVQVDDVELLDDDVVAILGLTEPERRFLHSATARIVAGGYEDEEARTIYEKLGGLDGLPELDVDPAP